MLRWLRSIFAWQDCYNTGLWLYQENAVTHKRRALRIVNGGFQPLHHAWLDGGPWSPTPLRRSGPPR